MLLELFQKLQTYLHLRFVNLHFWTSISLYEMYDKMGPITTKIIN